MKQDLTSNNIKNWKAYRIENSELMNDERIIVYDEHDEPDELNKLENDKNLVGTEIHLILFLIIISKIIQNTF